MNDHPHVWFLVKVGSTAAGVAAAACYATRLGIALPWIVATVAILAAIGCRPLDKRNAAALLRIRDLERESLEQRRAIYRLKKDDPQRGSRSSTSPQAEGTNSEALASAVQAIATELNETRLLECIVRTATCTLGVQRAILHLHDRASDRFQRGVAVERREGSLITIESPVLSENEVVLRLALKRRHPIEKDSADPEIRIAFEASAPDLVLAAPLFDRALVIGVLLIHGSNCDRAIAEILAATGSLALSATQRRKEIASDGPRSLSQEDRAHARS